MNAIAVPALNQAILMRREELVSALRGIVKDGQVIHDEPSCRVYGVDALNADASLPLAVVLPSSIREASQVLRYCYEAGLKVTPRGAGTSLVGGAVAPEDGIILCLSLMDRVLEVDPANRLVRVEAGITNVAVSEAAKAYGLRYAPDPSSRSSSTIGGNLRSPGKRSRRLTKSDQ